MVGDAGLLPGDVATPLAVVLNELMQNAADHAFPPVDGVSSGHVSVRVVREDGVVEVDVVDDGIGLPPGFTIEGSSGLGLSIVQALVTTELGGSIELYGDDGTRVHLSIPLHTIDRPLSSERRRAGGSARVEALLGEPRLAQLPPFLFGGAAPDARFLVRGERELEALLADGARGADPLGRLDLLECGPRAPDREEHVGVAVADTPSGCATP